MYAGKHAGGKLGHGLVVAFALVELFGGSCIVLMVRRRGRGCVCALVSIGVSMVM